MALKVQQLTETTFRNADWVCKGYRMADEGSWHISLYLPLVEAALSGAEPEDTVEIDGQMFDVYIGNDADGDAVAVVTNGEVTTGVLECELHHIDEVPYIGGKLADLVESLRNVE